MDLFLGILKFGGIIASGLLGVLTTLTQTHEEVAKGGRKRLNGWGKVAITFIILGFLTALGAQLAELIKKQHEADDARKRTYEQIRQATEILARLETQSKQSKATLNYIERLMLPFETIFISSRFELPTNEPFGSVITRFIEPRARSVRAAILSLPPPLDSPPFPRGYDTNRPPSSRKIAPIRPAFSRKSAPIFAQHTNWSQNVVGVFTTKSGVAVAATLDPIIPGGSLEIHELEGLMHIPRATELLIVPPASVDTEIAIQSLTNDFWKLAASEAEIDCRVLFFSGGNGLGTG